MAGKRWSELGPRARGLVAVASVAQVTLAATAWWDLAHRPASAVRGPKKAWAFAIAVNFIGPVAYLCYGRKR
ncbi:MAG TPA: PLDc N-terminal domain-containing protein [Amycolatopsis sp.]|uniref:PLDc N-terminal domain-containing protein n=1 Tax=Amycolatopsis sp. TaxID=37632 RepID=UPI002B47C5E4|nr:PLDc N-terminal domain-containing protein [Amycolatopsis sp.]HKS46916.1 PLDc N-terminal domain-containing protein [Amycolatopsis sp.]